MMTIRHPGGDKIPQLRDLLSDAMLNLHKRDNLSFLVFSWV